MAAAGDAETVWHVVQTHPRKEELARANLERQGFGSYLPRIRRVVSHARRREVVLRPLFPRYAFFSIPPGGRWRAACSTLGVSAVLMEGERPRRVPPGVVAGIAEALADGLDPALRVGRAVRFTAGPFASRIGLLVALPDAERARVLLDLLGAERLVETEPASLAAAEA